MLASLFRRPALRQQPERFCPRLEALEDRCCPSATPGTAPVIDMFSAQPIQGRTVQLTGHVTDANPASVQITFSGVMSGTATADSSGYFRFQGTASALGTVYANAVDGQGLSSNTAQAQVSVRPPVIDQFDCANMYSNYWVFYGHVQYGENPQGLTIVLVSGISQVNGLSVTVDAYGDFSVMVQLPQYASGSVMATLTDWWGQTATPAWTAVG